MNARLTCTVFLALSLSACAGTGELFGSRDKGRDGYTYDTPCTSCGTVERIESTPGGTAGLAGAGLVAAALTSSDDAAGREGRYAVTVRTDDGRRVVLEQRALSGLREGARVVVRQGRAVLM